MNEFPRGANAKKAPTTKLHPTGRVASSGDERKRGVCQAIRGGHPEAEAPE